MTTTFFFLLDGSVLDILCTAEQNGAVSYFETGQCLAERHTGLELTALLLVDLHAATRDPSRLRTTKSREALNIGSSSSRWQVSSGEKSFTNTVDHKLLHGLQG